MTERIWIGKQLRRLGGYQMRVCKRKPKWSPFGDFLTSRGRIGNALCDPEAIALVGRELDFEEIVEIEAHEKA